MWHSIMHVYIYKVLEATYPGYCIKVGRCIAGQVTIGILRPIKMDGDNRSGPLVSAGHVYAVHHAAFGGVSH